MQHDGRRGRAFIVIVPVGRGGEEEGTQPFDPNDHEYDLSTVAEKEDFTHDFIANLSLNSGVCGYDGPVKTCVTTL